MRSTRSCSRPGVATITCASSPASACAFERHAAVDGRDLDAAGRRRTRTPRSPGPRARASARARARPAADRPGSTRWTIGIANASVLPEPVGLLARTSPPRSASGMTRDWIWNGASMPRAASTSQTASDTPSERNSDSPCLDSFGRRDPVIRRRKRTSRERGLSAHREDTVAIPLRTVLSSRSSSSRSRCSSCATRSSSSSHSSRVTRPISRASSCSRRRVPSPTRSASPRQRPVASSNSERASSNRGPSSEISRSSGSRSDGPLPGASMRPSTAALAAAARFASRRDRSVDDRTDARLDDVHRRARACGSLAAALLGLAEHAVAGAPSGDVLSPCGARTPARAPSRSSAAAPR